MTVNIGSAVRWLSPSLCILASMMLNSASSVSATPNPEEKVTILLKDLGEKSLDVSVKANAGDVFQVRLEQKAIGKIWRLKDPDTKKFEVLGKPEVVRDKNTPGSSEFKVIRIKALGEGALTFEWVRPFGNPELQTAIVTVKAK